MRHKDMPKRIEIFYKDALDNIAFLKKQEWVIAGYGIAVHAAIWTISIRLNSPVLLIAAVWLAVIYAVVILGNFYFGIEKFRRRLKWIYQNYFDKNEQDGMDLLKARGLLEELIFVGGLCATLVVSAVIVSIAVCGRAA